MNQRISLNFLVKMMKMSREIPKSEQSLTLCREEK